MKSREMINEKWILADKKMPCFDQNVLATIRIHYDADDESPEEDALWVVYGSLKKGFYDGESYYDPDETRNHLVAWMQMPDKPYYEGDKELIKEGNCWVLKDERDN